MGRKFKDCDFEDCGVTDVAEFFGISIRQVQILVNEGVIPRKAKGRYNLLEAAPAYLDHCLFGPGSEAARYHRGVAEMAATRLQDYREFIADLRAQIKKLKVQIDKKGADTYTLKELKTLNVKLKDANQTLRDLQKPGK